nr:glycosyltransferase [Cryobacterium breve]
MPFYGDPALFRLAVQSVLDQDDPRWRLVVIDDLYPETGPGEWVIGLDEPRITYIRNEVNLGVSGNFRKCTELATAEFTTIVGCDDLLRPNYVSRIHQAPGRFSRRRFRAAGRERHGRVGSRHVAARRPGQGLVSPERRRGHRALR